MEDQDDDRRDQLEEEQVEGEGDDDEMELEEELQEAFVAGWRAKQKTAALRLKRGYVAPKSRDSWGGSSSDRPPPGSRSFPPNSDQKPDQRKASSHCADCGGLGHWRCDPECPKVASGEREPYTKKPSP